VTTQRRAPREGVNSSPSTAHGAIAAPDYRTVAAAVNAGLPVWRLRHTDLHQQLEIVARALVGLQVADAAS
jgi:hypothetical protein